MPRKDGIDEAKAFEAEVSRRLSLNAAALATTELIMERYRQAPNEIAFALWLRWFHNRLLEGDVHIHILEVEDEDLRKEG